MGRAILRGRGGGGNSFEDHSSHDLMLIEKGSIGVDLSKDGAVTGSRVSGGE